MAPGNEEARWQAGVGTSQNSRSHHITATHVDEARQRLRVCANEALVVAIAARDIANGLQVDGDRVSDAARRLLNALELSGARS